MITEFNFTNEWQGDQQNWVGFYVENFPIDLKVGDEIWIIDFKHLFKKGEYYYPENKISNDFLEDFDIPEAKVTHLRYGLQDGKVVKILELMAT
jgi:hypothetical protein|tara:strand:+ start:974 stop:1255 length:282 start_codon:yes stop_codon:yes gene_type:complete